MALATEIDEEECLGLLTGATFGRVALNAKALPRIVPVSLTVYPGPRIAAHLQCDEDLGEALDGAVVALQADGFDDGTQRVWSVHVVGRVTIRCGPDIVIDPGVIDGVWLD